MAWQLIYTSAPRLLEAGRTGFGTVARHRAVSGLLATTVERFSQFARLTGHDPRRVVHNHRILTIGSGQFHVLSCLRDAGSDYTGRTNHIAHHLIAEAREVRPLAAAGITPADVLLAMSWCTSWNDRPRFLDPSDEIDLTSMHPQPSHAWEQVTGSRDNSRLPWSPVAQRGCYLIIPPGTDARILFRESLQEMMAQAWQTTFTTSLEPNDDVADFRWIGMSPGSPMRTLVETSARPVFDLLQPSGLPAPPPLLSGSAVAETDRTTKIPTPPAFSPQPDQNPPRRLAGPQKQQDDNHALQEGDMQTLILPEAGLHQKQESKRSLPTRALLIISVLLASAGAGLLHLFNQRQENQGLARLEKRIDDIWGKYHLKLDDTRKWLKQEASNPAAADNLISSHEDCLKQIRQSLQQPQSDHGVVTPDRTRDDFSEMLNAHADWLRKHSIARVSPDWRVQKPSDAKIMMERWEEEKRAWRRFAGSFTQDPAVDQSDHQQLVQRVLAALKADARPAGTPEEWRRLLLELGETTRAEWLQDWSKLESLGNRPSAGSLQTLMVQLAKQPDVPEWFKSLLREKKQAADAALVENRNNESVKAPMTIMPAKPSAENPDSPDALHPIFILARKEGEVLGNVLAKLPELPAEPVMTLQLGGVTSRAEDLGEPWKLLGSAYRQSISSNDKIHFEGGRLSHLPESKEGCRLVARSDDGQRVLFDLRISVKSSQTPELLTFDKMPELHFVLADSVVRLDEIGRIIKRLHLIEAPAPQFQLRFEGKKGAAAEQRLYSVKAGKDDAYLVTFPSASADGNVLEIRRLLASEAELNDGIKKDREFIRNLNPRMAGREKKEAELKAGISEKEIRLAGVAGQLEALQRQVTPMVSLPPGIYTLLEMTGTIRNICRVHITRSIRVPASGKSNP